MEDWKEFPLGYVMEPKKKFDHLGVHKKSLNIPDITSGLFEGAPSVRWVTNKYGLAHQVGQYYPSNVIEVFVCLKGWAQIDMHSKERCGTIVLNSDEKMGLIVNWEIHRAITLSSDGMLMILASDKADHDLVKMLPLPVSCRCKEVGPDGKPSSDKVQMIMTELKQSIKDCYGDRALSDWIYRLKIDGVTIPETWRERWGSYFHGVGMALCNFPECNDFDGKTHQGYILKELKECLLSGVFPSETLRIDGSWYVFADDSHC
ncbi:MAG: hypothetical protein QG620_318 [Patescibacteria group bacterium]|nr:hypothetical protein [Patescibacteria group bacterium]